MITFTSVCSFSTIHLLFEELFYLILFPRFYFFLFRNDFIYSQTASFDLLIVIYCKLFHFSISLSNSKVYFQNSVLADFLINGFLAPFSAICNVCYYLHFYEAYLKSYLIILFVIILVIYCKLFNNPILLTISRI